MSAIFSFLSFFANFLAPLFSGSKIFLPLAEPKIRKFPKKIPFVGYFQKSPKLSQHVVKSEELWQNLRGKCFKCSSGRGKIPPIPLILRRFSASQARKEVCARSGLSGQRANSGRQKHPQKWITLTSKEYQQKYKTRICWTSLLVEALSATYFLRITKPFLEILLIISLGCESDFSYPQLKSNIFSVLSFPFFVKLSIFLQDFRLFCPDQRFSDDDQENFDSKWQTDRCLNKIDDVLFQYVLDQRSTDKQKP